MAPIAVGLILGEMVEKLVADGHSLPQAVCWATSAKNSLANVKGFSPNQLVFGYNPNFPNVLTNKLPALEPCRYQDKLFDTLKAMKEARESYIRLEADERLKRAVKKKTRKHISQNCHSNLIPVFISNVKDSGEVLGRLWGLIIRTFW